MNKTKTFKEKIKKDKAKKTLTLLNKQLTRLQKGIDRPHAVFKKLEEYHYTVEFKL